jgi:hypothetical protein
MPPFGSKFVIEVPSIKMSALTPAAIGYKVRAGIINRVLVALVVDTGRKLDKVQYITIHQGQIVDELAVDYLSRHGVFGIDGLPRRLNLNDLLRRGDLQSQVCCRILANV